MCLCPCVCLHNLPCVFILFTLFHWLLMPCNESREFYSIILDYVMIPTPYYGGFDLDICRRARVKVYPVDCSSDNDFIPTIKLLEDTLTKARNEVWVSLVAYNWDHVISHRVVRWRCFLLLIQVIQLERCCQGNRYKKWLNFVTGIFISLWWLDAQSCFIV